MPTPVMQHTAVKGDDGRIYVIGGRTSSGNAPIGTVQVYNPATHTWSIGASMLIPKVQFGAVTASNGNIYVIGGKASMEITQGHFSIR
jgi:N-acetylneuraminic acid mutarotase